MINNLKILAFIPARGGSKGIKDKNIYLIKGKPLIWYTINAAKKSKYIDKIIVSTDSDKIAKIVNNYGDYIPFLRPKKLATDYSKIIDSVLYTIKNIKEKYNVLILLQPTSPLRTTTEIDKALEQYAKTKKDIASANLININPLLLRTINNSKEAIKLVNDNSSVRRQDLPCYYKINGAIYINSIDRLSPKTSFNDNKTIFVMDNSHSIDIDKLDDIKSLIKMI